MARLTQSQQSAKYAEARRLSQRGYTRRQINAILREEFGEGIRPARYTPIYRERVAVVTRKEADRPAPQRKFRSSRQARYDWLVDRHFTDDEATRLSKLRTLQTSKGIAKMVATRAALWEQFLRISTARGWNKEQRRDGWRRGLSRWYKRNGYITKRSYRGKKRPSAWMWYKGIQKQLPIEDQDDTPRLHDRGFTTTQFTTPQLVDWTRNLRLIRDQMDRHGKTAELRNEERRVLGNIRGLKRK